MSAIVRFRGDDREHLSRLRQELGERGYDVDYPGYSEVRDHIAVSSKDVKFCNRLKSADEIYADLENMLYGFVEVAYIAVNKARARISTV